MTTRINVTPPAGGEGVEIYESDFPRFKAMGWKITPAKKSTTPPTTTKKGTE
jgi:hypothetical protein